MQPASYLGIAGDRLAGKVAEQIGLLVPVRGKGDIGKIGFNESAPPMASFVYLIFVYSRVLFCKQTFMLVRPKIG